MKKYEEYYKRNYFYNLEFKPEIEQLILIFYILEGMYASLINLNQEIQWHHSVEKLIKELNEYRIEFNHNFAMMLNDYTAICCLGELRHLIKHAFRLPTYEHCYIPYFNGTKTEKAYIRSRQWVTNEPFYVKQDIIKISQHCFNPTLYQWDAEYGGANWYKIAKSALLFNRVQDNVYIDYCLDIQHNGGNFLDRITCIFEISSEDKIQQLLNQKKYYSTLHLIYRNYNFTDSLINSFITRWINILLQYNKNIKKNAIEFPCLIYIQIESKKSHYYEGDVAKVFIYKPLTFGSKHINVKDIKIDD